MKPFEDFLSAKLFALAFVVLFAACKKNDNHNKKGTYVKVENVLMAKDLVESGVFKGAGIDPVPPVIFPGQELSFSFSAGKGQSLMFATMYGWSNDLFFAPANPGIKLFDSNGMPMEGDVSDQVKLWDNGTRVNQMPGMAVVHPGDPENMVVAEVSGTDAQGNNYLPASQLMKATLTFDGNSVFTFTMKNTSGGTINETPFSPGVWAVSNILGGNLLNAMPFFEAGKTAPGNGITEIAEAGDNSKLWEYAMTNTKIFTPLSPILIVIYSGKSNPIFSLGEPDRGNGLADIAQTGDATMLKNTLNAMPEVRRVYVVPAPQTTVLLPSIDGNPGGSIEQKIEYRPGDRITFVTMFGYSNDWFFSFDGSVNAGSTGDFSDKIRLYDDGTAVDQYPGAGNSQGAFGGAPQTPESKPIDYIGDTYPVPAVTDIIKLTVTRY